jgi:hypothetical protein
MHQLHGTMSVDGSDGFSCRVVFPCVQSGHENDEAMQC